MHSKGYYFLASPFKGTPEEKAERYNLSKKIAATFLEHGQSLFAPILYNEAVITFFPDIKPEDRCQLLMPMNLDLLLQSKAMVLLKLEGWDTSWGISQYLDVCRQNNIEIYELSEENLDHDIEVLLHTLQKKSSVFSS